MKVLALTGLKFWSGVSDWAEEAKRTIPGADAHEILSQFYVPGQ